MNHRTSTGNLLAWMSLSITLHALCAFGQTTQTGYKTCITFPDDPYAYYTQEGEPRWVKFTIVVQPSDPNVYFQNGKSYLFHHPFATKCLRPFLGMTLDQFNAISLFEENQQAVLGAVLFPPMSGSPPVPLFNEYGIQFVRQEPYAREEIRDLFNRVKACVAASPDVQALYFPTYEQQAAALADRGWFESQGIFLGSTARWIEGNACYSQGWALGTLKFVTGSEIATAYHAGQLEPNDILLTDGVPAEVPFLAGIISLAPSTPNSHVAILAKSYGVPFVHLAVSADAERARQLVGRRIIYSAYDDAYGDSDVRLIDTTGLLDDATAEQIVDLKRPPSLDISPMAPYGAIGASTEPLTPADARYFGGKAANSGILRQAIPDNSPQSIALSFDLWNAFLDQSMEPTAELVLAPGQCMLFWADDDEEQGPTHTSFALSRDGEAIALYAGDGSTLIDAIEFGPQDTDISYGRSVDAGDAWQAFTTPTPGRPNSSDRGPAGRGLVINEFMAVNRRTIQDPCEPGEYADWIELYNASDNPIVLNGLYLTDDVNRPTKWQIPPVTHGGTLREEIQQRLSKYDSYPPRDLQMLYTDLAAIRAFFANAHTTPLDAGLRDAVVSFLADPQHGFDPSANLRFRSSTNVEDSEDFVGAGMYDSYSGCLADDLDDDTAGPCACDPNRETEDSVFDAIRQAFASFYNDNAYLERLRRGVNETQVGMALLVHHSFPDEIELANGVATVEHKSAKDSTFITLITQKDAVSVTNPEGDAIPEEVVVEVLPSGYIQLNSRSLKPLKQPSSLVPAGRTVMDWIDDYKALVTLLMQVSNRFSVVTGKTSYTLDLEYKKVAPGGRAMPAGGLVVKQVRQVPSPSRMQTPFIVNVPIEFEVFPGEFALFDATDVFADHRLKSRWRLETRTMPLDSNNLALGLYGRVEIEYLDGDYVRTVGGDVSLLPSAKHTFDANESIDSWQLTDLDNPRTYHLYTTNVPTSVLPTQCPIFTLADLGSNARNIMNVDLPYKCLGLTVDYEKPVTSWTQRSLQSSAASGLSVTMTNRVYLWPRQNPSDGDILQERSFTSGGISIHASFYYPPPPGGFGSWELATAPLLRWKQTVIAGLTDDPIVLEGYYSQTYRPEHHNQIENFLFEPRLEPGISAAILDQLNERNIRFIHLTCDNTGGGQSQIAIYGFD
ncbi:MAG: hypothetical protein JW955_09265 [Sedimentisphaerales bacterium]|nr:hypothetical protein [Sedimentisphaerales bacterium]